MLQALREKTSGWMAFIILASVGVPFAFFGINNYFETRTESFVARVGKQEITPQQFRERLERLRAQAHEQQGANFDAAYFSDPTVKRQILDRMVDEELLQEAATRAGAATSDARVRREIADIKAFQVDGKFSPDQYTVLLQARGMSPAGFEREIRRDLELRALPLALGASTPVSEAEVDRYVKLRDQSRDFRYYFVVMPADATPVSDGDLEHYYNAHRDDYMSPEQVALEYLELNAADLEVPAEVDDTTLKARYEEQKARYSVNEQRLASHILVKVDKGADAEAHKQAQAKAQALVEQARAGKNFADLAKSSSDDLGSKNQGGDLGWLEHGLTEPAFDAALFKLNAGEISDPVLTDQGFHVIQLREVKAGSVKPFESVRADLMKEYVESERERRYSEISGRLIDLVYQNPGSLEPAAEALKLKPQRTPLFGREGGPGVAANPNVLKKAFSDSVLVDGNASDPIDIGTNHVVVIRVAEHKPKAARPLAEVKDAVLARFRAEKIADAAKAKAEELRKQIAGGASFDQLQKDANATASTAKGVGRRAKNQDPTLVQEAFKLPRPAQGKSSLAVVDLPLNRFAVVEVTEASDGDPSKLDEAARKSVREELVRNIGASEVRGLLDVLRARTPTKVVEDRL